MDLDDAGTRARLLIHDRDATYCALIDEIPAEAGIQTVLTGIRIPRMNAITERWIGSLSTSAHPYRPLTRTRCPHGFTMSSASEASTATGPGGHGASAGTGVAAWAAA